MHTLLQQNTSCEAIVHVPQVDTRYAALKVPVGISHAPPATPLLCIDSQLPVHVKGLVRLNLHLTDTITRRDTLLNGRLELIAPWTPPAVAVAVVVAAQEVALRLGALLHGKRDVDGFEQVFFERGVELDNVVDIALDVLWVQSAQEVARTSC